MVSSKTHLKSKRVQSFINLFLVFLLLFALLPASAQTVHAQSDNTTSQETLISDNVTNIVPTEIVNISVNHTSEDGNNTSEILLSERNYVLIRPDRSTEISSSDEKVSLVIPEGAVDKPVAVDLSLLYTPGSTGMKIITLFELNAWEVNLDELTTSDNHTSDTPSTDDETDVDIPDTSDNTTIDIPDTSDNVTMDIPDTSDNATLDIADTSDNVTLDILDTSDNTTVDIPDMSDNTTLDIPDTSDNTTLDIPGTSDNVTLDIPDMSDNTTQNITDCSDNLTQEQIFQAIDFEKKVTSFNKQLTISIQHDPDDLKGLDIDSLRLFYLDENTLQWVVVESSHYNRETNTLTASIDHFSYYGEQANPLVSGPGKVMAAQVNLHSGAAMYSYPLELPPGPGGFQPKLELVYNSGSVNEMKNKRSMGSWVGIGWSLSLGKITLDTGTNLYSLDLNGSSYKLVSLDNVNFRTNPEQYLEITKSGNTWTVLDKDGTSYTFGGTTDSQQYVDGSAYYRWDLSQIEDTNGNTANVTYTRTIISNWVRSAYPEYLEYGNVEVHFTSSSDENYGSDGDVRYDNPITYGSNPAPKIMENKKLDSIEIEINDTLVRKYEFDYTTTDRVYSSDYSGTYYSGQHKLDSITQVGADGSSELPTIEFTYQNLQTYRYTDEGDYTGNPGNPASFSWAHLTTINSGYGGSISFSYTQIPNTSTQYIWTREAVTTKTINSGVGVNEVYTYSYTGNPQYRFSGWEQEFRGWNEVRETDSAGNYLKHWYYTTDTINNKDAEKLSGKEYKTQWYDSLNNLLKERVYGWDYVTTGSTPDIHNIWDQSLYNGVGVSNDGDIYTSYQWGQSQEIRKFTTHGNLSLEWGSYGTGDGQFKSPWGIAVDSNGYVYVVEYDNYRVQKFDSSGNFTLKWGSFGTGDGQFRYPKDVTVDSNNYIYITDSWNSRVQKFNSSGNYISKWTVSSTATQAWDIAIDSSDAIYVTTNNGHSVKKYDSSGNYITEWGGYGTGDGQFNYCRGIAVDSDDNVYVGDYINDRVQVFDSNGNFIRKWTFDSPIVIEVYEDSVYVSPGSSPFTLHEYTKNWTIQLDEVSETTYGDGGNKTTRTRYEYDDYGNVTTEYRDGDLSTNNDDATIHRVFYYNTTDNIVNRPDRERVYATIMTEDSGGGNLKSETRYYYDGNNSSNTTQPTEGNLTRIESKSDSSNLVYTDYEYDSFGNKLTEEDPNGNITSWTYETTHHTYPATKTYPVTGLSESYTYDPGTNNMLTMTDVNSQTTTYQYDTFKRLTKAIKPGDTSESPTIEYLYNDWGTLGDQNIEIRTKTSGDYLWQKDYFDGLGRVIQTQAEGETGKTIISGTTTYNNRGLVDKQYVSQDEDSAGIDGYEAPGGGWKYTSYTYDALGRIVTQTNADDTTVSHDFSYAWQELVTNERGYKTRYYYDAFGQLVKVEELNASHQLYATTEYGYDTLGNLLEVEDDDGNTTVMTYDWLSRKTSMSDPDMGSWSYIYDYNGNLLTQTDAKSQTITFSYDNINRLTGKTYSAGNMTSVSYTYDDTSGGNYGKGLRTGMTDALGTISYIYDTRGRLIEEDRVADSVHYITEYTYDSADRLVTVTYPTDETVTQTYNGRGLPYSVSGSVAGNLVTGMTYNGLGLPVQINLNNGIKTTYGYYGTAGDYDTTGGYYGRLWEIKTLPQGGGTALMDVQHTWDAGGNLATRQDVLVSETETFGYDFLDRLTSVSGPYSSSYSYDEIGNIVTRNGYSYSYDSTQPHAVDSINGTSYYYDSNGNMTDRSNQDIVWDAENRPVSITEGGSTTTFVYDGDGNRVMKVEGGETILYVSKYYEKNLTTSTVTTSYYLRGMLVAQREGTTLRYVHQDHLTGTSLMTSDNGTSLGAIKYYPYGDTRSGDVPTDKKFTGQRLDDTGLYYYGARYYDASIGRFISPDTIIPYPANPQSYNRYSYCLNNPLKYIDPSGHEVNFTDSIIENLEYYMAAGQYWMVSVIMTRLEELQNDWGILQQNEPDYTQHMIDSEIIFNIIDVDPATQTITYNAEMKNEVHFEEPVQLRFIDDEWYSWEYQMMGLLDATGFSVYPLPILIRTDTPRNARSFTWLVAHESFHRYEQIPGPRRWVLWYVLWEYPLNVTEHDKRPSEKRANNYADTYYPKY